MRVKCDRCDAVTAHQEDLKAQLERERAAKINAIAELDRSEHFREKLQAEIAELSKDPMLVYSRKITLLRKTIDTQREEIARLKEFEWKYKELCK